MVRRNGHPMVFVGCFCILVALYQVFVFSQPHFYTLFSTGMFALFWGIHDRIATEPLFSGWGVRHALFFFATLSVVCVVIDQAGIALGYWTYPHYGADDQLRKYVFEWAVALLYHMAALSLGTEILVRTGMDRRHAFPASLLAFVTLVGLFTEALNMQVQSWVVLSMPVSDYQIGGFYVIFQTLGYWLMALIPYLLYRVTGRLFEKP